MNDKFIPKLRLKGDISATQLNTMEKPGSMRLDNIGTSNEIPKFKQVFTDLVQNVNHTMKAPDQIMEDAMLGNGADIHDVMIAINKASLSVQVSTQMTSKVVQAYEKVMSIQL